MVIIKELLQRGSQILAQGVEAPKDEATYLLCELLQKDRLYISVHRDMELCPQTEKTFLDRCKRRALGEPYAYIVGHKEFMSLCFKVDKRVLIPRPETELLTELIIERHKASSPSILDICTGSGAIACSLAHYIKGSNVYAMDISPHALCVARENAKNILTSKKVHFFEANALENFWNPKLFAKYFDGDNENIWQGENGTKDIGQHTFCQNNFLPVPKKFDIVVSNPPYIETKTLETLDSTVKNHEPRLALDGGFDGLIFYEKIVHNIENVLKPKGELYFEIGCNQGGAVASIMKEKFLHTNVIKDYAGLDRIVWGQLA